MAAAKDEGPTVAAVGLQGLAQSVSHQCTSAPCLPMYAGNREAWAYEILDFVGPALAAKGIQLPAGRTIRVGVLPLSRSRLGECHPTSQSASGTVSFIGICTKQANPRELVHTLIHEFLHACDDCQSGHRHRWARWAAAVGMKAKGHERSAALAALIDSALHRVGVPSAHEPSVGGLQKLSLPSQQRVSCLSCNAHAYMPMGAATAGYFVSCGPCGLQMIPARART